ncbi:MAG: glycosyltransferase [Bacteroidales bacterium]
MPNLLYFSCHETLERYECQIFSELGFNVFSCGHYLIPQQPIHSTLPPLDLGDGNRELLEIFRKYHKNEERKIIQNLSNAHKPEKVEYLFFLNKNFLDKFDIVVCDHFFFNIVNNFDKSDLSKKFFVYRTVTQPIQSIHPWTKKIKIVFMSPKERFLHGIKPDAIIRQCVCESEYKDWIGKTDIVLTVNKWMKKRGAFAAWREYKYVTRNFNRLLVGFSNEDVPWAMECSPEDLQSLRQISGCYFSCVSKPSTITYTFIESLMTGIPVVSIGEEIGNMFCLPSFEVQDFIKNGENGFISSNLDELSDYIRLILTDRKLADSISKKGRETAIENFSIKIAREQWKNFFGRYYG